MDRRHKFCGSWIPGQTVCPRNGREKARIFRCRKQREALDCFTTLSHQLKSRHPAASWALKLPRREDHGDGLIGGDEKGSLLSWTRQNLVELAGNIHNYDGSGWIT